MPVRGSILAVVLCALGCGSGGSSPAALDAASGGSSGGAGGGGVPGTGGAEAGGSGGAGMGGSSGGGGAGGSSARGTFDSIWQRSSADLQITDTKDPGSLKQGSVTFPAGMAVPGDGRTVEFYEQLKDDAHIIYAYLAGQGVYYRFSYPAIRVDETYLVVGAAGQHLFELKEGRLVDNTTSYAGTTYVVSIATYTRYTGAFPPATWPLQMVEVK